MMEAIKLKKIIQYLLCLSILLIVVCSCSDKISIKKDFDFEVKVLPYHSTLELNETVELRCTILPVGGNYDKNDYQIRYFQYEGKGSFANAQGIVFLPNDLYSLPSKEFRLYFTPTSGESHRLVVVIIDGFGKEKTLDFTFSTKQNKLLPE